MSGALVRWLCTLGMGVVIAGGVGAMLEWLVERICYYQMYSPNELLNVSLLWGAPIASVAAAFQTIVSPDVRWRRLVIAYLWVLGQIIGLSLLGGMTLGFIVKYGSSPLGFSHVSVPLPRVAFCFGVVWGAFCGGILALFSFPWYICRLAR